MKNPTHMICTLERETAKRWVEVPMSTLFFPTKKAAVDAIYNLHRKMSDVRSPERNVTDLKCENGMYSFEYDLGREHCRKEMLKL